jgi:hypothetical protein
MAETVADHLLSRLREWGVRQVDGVAAAWDAALMADRPSQQYLPGTKDGD